jgi:hypothetical protein
LSATDLVNAGAEEVLVVDEGLNDVEAVGAGLVIEIGLPENKGNDENNEVLLSTVKTGHITRILNAMDVYYIMYVLLLVILKDNGT